MLNQTSVAKTMKLNRPTRPPRVVIVVQNLPVPFDRRVWLEATSLTKAGYDVTCICPTGKGFDTTYQVIDGIRVHRYRVPVDANSNLGFLFEFVWCFLRTGMKLARVATTRGVDVLHICNPPETYFPFAWIVRLAGRKFLFDHHDLSPEMFEAKIIARPDKARLSFVERQLRRGLTWCEKQTFLAANLVITTNESHKRIAIERGKRNPEDVIVVRSGPDLDRLTPTEPVKHWRNGKRFLAAYLGEICEQDGVDHLVRAMKHLRDDLGATDVHCVFVGGGPHQQVIKDYADELGVAEICHFTGRVSDELLSEILSSADIGVDPDPLTPWSNQSTMNKIMEYMVFELPIVSYNLDEARVSAQDAALFVEPNDELALAAGMLELFHDPDRRREMGKFGRARVEDKLSWAHSEPNLLAAYSILSAS